MLLHFTDINTNQTVAINPKHVVCVFVNKDEKTEQEVVVVNTLSGNVALSDGYLDVVGRINASLN